MQRSFAFPGWCAICRWTAVGAISVGTMAVLGAATTDHRPPPTVVRLAALPEGNGLDSRGWAVRDPAEQRRSLDLLLIKEKARRAAEARTGASAVPVPTLTVAPGAAGVPGAPGAAVPAAAVAGVPPSALGSGTTLTAPQAVSVAIKFALAQVGKPYVWGATGPDSYDCSGLVQRSYRMAGIALPRTSREQARVGTAVDLPDLLPGDLLFWAYNPSDLSTVHHVAMYLGDGKIIQAPQPGEFVEVTTMWLSGYAGAVRVATGPATAPLPPVPAGVPGTGVTPVGDAMPDGSPPPSVPPAADTPPRSGTRAGATSPRTATQGTAAPHTAAPASTSPRTSSPATSKPATSKPATSSPGTTSPGSTTQSTGGSGTGTPAGAQSDSTSGTTSPATPSPTSSPSGAHTPSDTATGTATETSAPSTTAPAPPTSAPAPSTSSAAPSTSAPAPSTSSAAPSPTSEAPAPPSSSAPATTAATPTTTTPPPSPSGTTSASAAAEPTTTSAPPSPTPSVSPHTTASSPG